MDGPHELPPALLTRPEMIAACRNRDFTSVFALVKRHAGIYPARIAALCDMTPSRVGEIMSGQRGLAHIDVIERVADGLRIPGAMLGLAQRGWETPAAVVSIPEPPPSRAAHPTKRATDLAEILHTLEAEQVTRSTLAAMRSSIEGYWRQDDQHGGAPLRPALVGQLGYAQRLIAGTQEGPLRRDLVAVAAELARLAGWAYFDARQYSTARGFFTQALHLAQNVTDRQFVANVLSCMSLQATYEGDAHEAAALAAAAQDSARGTATPDLVMATLYMREAFAQAMMRDHTECHRAIGKANGHFERADHASSPQWVRYFDETKLIVDTGIALAQLGEHGKAEPLIAEGLRRENHEQARGRAFHTLWLASAQLSKGALDEACTTAGKALDLVTSVDSPRVATHIREFHQRLAGHAGEAPVVAFEARMRAAFA